MSLSCVRIFTTPWTETHQAPPLTPRVCSNSCPLIRWCYLTISSSATPFSSCLQTFLSSGLFRLTFHIKWPKLWSFSFSISPSDESCKLISFRTYWFDILTVQRALRGLPQQHNLKASIFWCPAFYLVQISHLYMTTGKATPLTRRTFVHNTFLFFNTPTRFVIVSLPRGKCLFISWLQSLQSLSAVISEPKKIKSVTASIFSPSVRHEVMGPDAIIISLSPSWRGFSVPLHFLPLEWNHLYIWGCWYFSQHSWFHLVIDPARHFAWYTLHRNKISKEPIYRLAILFSQFLTSQFFHVHSTLLLDLHTGFSADKSDGLVLPSLFHSLLWSIQSKALV